MKFFAKIILLLSLTFIFSGCALHRGGNYHDYINNKIYFYGSYNKPLGWGKLRYSHLKIGQYLAKNNDDVKFTIKLKDGRVLRISYNHTTEDNVKPFAVEIEKNQTFVRDGGGYARYDDGYIGYVQILDDTEFENVREYTIVRDKLKYGPNIDAMRIYFHNGKIIYIVIYCNNLGESDFFMGRYGENKFFKMPLTQEQVEYIFGKPEFYRIYWY